MNLELAKRDLIKIYKSLKRNIDLKIKEFEVIGNSGDLKAIFRELAFCLLTPSSKAENAWEAVLKLESKNLLFEGEKQTIAGYLNSVRFKNTKAENIVLARNLIFGSNSFSEVFNRLKYHPYNFREWLVKNIRGMAYKESTHFLRNIGLSVDLCILDRHILRSLFKYNVIEKIPESLNKSRYLKIEKKFQEFSKAIKIDVKYLDFIFWYTETGRIFK